jgi:hypothetical protein
MGRREKDNSIPIEWPTRFHSARRRKALVSGIENENGNKPRASSVGLPLAPCITITWRIPLLLIPSYINHPGKPGCPQPATPFTVSRDQISTDNHASIHSST